MPAMRAREARVSVIHIMYIPLLGRVSILEWPVIILSFFLAWGEYVLLVITKCLPQSAIDACTSITKWVFDKLERSPKCPAGVDQTRYRVRGRIGSAKNIQEMAQVHGFEVESHVLQTKDGYLLTAHRIRPRGPPNGKVVYLHHGLLMCSEVWVTMVDKYRNLPYLLADLGFDVWLGNNRGNKYSLKHVTKPQNSISFWNFCMDEFALFDIPDTIDYILYVTQKPHLTYIGFSQGTSQAFAAMSVHPKLNKQIDQFIGISPATTPNGLQSRFLDAFVKLTPQAMFLMFGRRVLMPLVYFWEKVCYPKLFVTMIDLSNRLLFNWKSENILKYQKWASYMHLYLTTSVKLVVHWFQIMKARRFQMFSDVQLLMFQETTPTFYNFKLIKVPIHIIYGDSDSLVDIDVMKNQLPRESTVVDRVPGHEHLDNLWSDDVYETVFKHALRSLGVLTHVSDALVYGQVPLIEEIVDTSLETTIIDLLSFRRSTPVASPRRERRKASVSLVTGEHSFSRNLMI